MSEICSCFSLTPLIHTNQVLNTTVQLQLLLSMSLMISIVSLNQNTLLSILHLDIGYTSFNLFYRGLPDHTVGSSVSLFDSSPLFPYTQLILMCNFVFVYFVFYCTSSPLTVQSKPSYILMLIIYTHTFPTSIQYLEHSRNAGNIC